MKKIMRKSRVCAVLFLMFFSGIFTSPVYGQEKTEEFTFTHTHEESCYLMQVTNKEADGTPYGEITKRETCKLCGAELHHYTIQTKCSCGAVFDRTGFACMNSPYGSNVGECSNYEVVEDTMHAHEEQVQVCPFTENDVVAKVAVYRSSTALTRENVNLRVVLEKGSGSVYFLQNGSAELSVSNNTDLNISISYDERFKNRTLNKAISVKNIDKAAPSVAFQISPADWTEGNCVINVQASDSSDGGNAVSGIAGYSFDAGKTWGTANVKEFSDTMRSEIWVKDNAGNITKQSFFAEKKEPPSKEVPSQDTEEPVEDTETPSEQKEPLIERGELPSEQKELPQDGEEIPVENSEMPPSVTKPGEKLKEAGKLVNREAHSELKSEGHYVQSQSDISVAGDIIAMTNNQETEETDVTETKETPFTFASMCKRVVRWMKKPAVAVSLSAASITGGVLLLAGYYFLIGMGTVACVDVTGSEKFLAKIVVRRKKGKWRIVIGEDIAMRCRTKNLVLYVPSWFAKLFAYQTISIDMPNGIHEFYVEKRLSFLLLE